MGLENCHKCERLFHQTFKTKTCPECREAERQQLNVVYDLLVESEAEGGLTTVELAEKTGISEEDLEHLLHHQGLGMVAGFLKTPCQKCSTMVMATFLRGRYCYTCSEAFAKEAGITLKSPQQERAESSREAARDRLKGMTETRAVKAEKDSGKDKQYGLRRNRV